MSAATVDRYLAPAGARAVRGRSTAKGRSPAAQLHQDPQGRRARWRPSPGLFEARHRRPLRSGARSGEFARTAEHDPTCSPVGARRARGLDRRLGAHRPRRGAADRKPGASTPARSRPHGKTDQATIETREATTWCAATPPCYRHGRRRRAPGAGPPVRASPAPESTPPGPHPQAHQVGRQQGRWAQAPAGRPPHTPRPAAGHRRPGRRPEGRIDRLPQPAQPRRHHPPHRRAPGRPRPPGQGSRPTSTRPARTPSIPPDVHKSIRVRRAPAAPDHAGSPTRDTEEASRAP